MQNILNLENEAQKRNYWAYLKGPKRLAENTIEGIQRSIYKFDDFIGNDNYKSFNKKIAKNFQDYLDRLSYRGKKISEKTIYRALIDVQKFLYWLSGQSGYKSKIHKNDVEYLNPSYSITTIAHNSTPRIYPMDINYLKRLVIGIKGKSELAKRDRALISFLISTGMRAEAITTLSVGCVDCTNMDRMIIDQNPAKGVMTKFRRRHTTLALEIDSIFTQCIQEWLGFLRERNIPSDYPLFPKAEICHKQGTFSFVNNKISNKFIQSSSQVSHILKKRCSETGEKYYSAHTIRHLHVHIAEKAINNLHQLKAFSQNVGHKDIATTLSAYAYLPALQQIEILKNMDFRTT